MQHNLPGIPMLGGLYMSVSNADSRGSADPPPLNRAQSLLEEALAIIDSHADAPELGARLQEIIDSLRERSS